MVFSALGAAYGTAKSGTGIAAMSVMRPQLIMKSIIPVVMAGKCCYDLFMSTSDTLNRRFVFKVFVGFLSRFGDAIIFQ